MGTRRKEEFLDSIVEEIGNRKGVFSAILCVESGDNSFSWTRTTGEMQKDSQYFIASVTKLCFHLPNWLYVHMGISAKVGDKNGLCILGSQLAFTILNLWKINRLAWSRVKYEDSRWLIYE